MMQADRSRPGEVALDLFASTPLGPSLAPIGRIRSPWSKGNCPKNLREARAAASRSSSIPPGGGVSFDEVSPDG